MRISEKWYQIFIAHILFRFQSVGGNSVYSERLEEKMARTFLYKSPTIGCCRGQVVRQSAMICPS